jgi:hypothetical protein
MTLAVVFGPNTIYLLNSYYNNHKIFTLIYYIVIFIIIIAIFWRFKFRIRASFDNYVIGTGIWPCLCV